MRLPALRRFLRTKAGRYALLASFVLILLLSFGVRAALNYKSPEYIKNEQMVMQTIAMAWPLKHLACVESNQDKMLEIRKRLAEYYNNSNGELTKQQRFITLGSDNSQIKGALPESYENYYLDENQAIVDFKIMDYKFNDIIIKKNRATVKADIEYRIERRMLSQQYPTIASNAYQWELEKSNDKWMIVKEEMVQTDKPK